MARNLLLVSGVIDPRRRAQIAAGERPRADYFEIAAAIDGDILDYGAMRASQGSLGRLLDRVSPNLALAWATWRRRRDYDLVFSDGEQVGMPLAALFALGRRPKHVMIVHILSVPKKVRLFDWFGLAKRIDRFVVYSTWQQRFIVQRLGVPAERVVWSPFQADSRFFQPLPDVPLRQMICSAGLEFRDYDTLLEAVQGLDLEVIIAAASPWSKRADGTQGRPLPDNVTVSRYNLHELRQVYAASRFVVVPLHEVDFQAGVTTILEAMAMSKAVVVTRTPGQTDVVVDGETGLYVPPADPQALRAAIERLLADPAEAARLGRNGRRRLESYMSLDRYVEGLSQIVKETLQADR